ncbi:two-component sensor histidine kinase [Calothrix sp. NIES-4071]|nr:two-component sensor histidine kinase [Calothrix sp. NIES-4071]BAZ63323.1 two-component sensor histidine kinase [Calothrix sp. NIES-4105]
MKSFIRKLYMKAQLNYPLLRRQTRMGVRMRLLAWYFLLTACTVIVSLQVTRQIYCDSLKAKADASIIKEIERFKLMSDKYTYVSTPKLLDKFITNYAPTRNEYVITLLNDQVYKSKPELSQDIQEKLPSLVQQWRQKAEFERGKVYIAPSRIRYAGQSMTKNEDKGTVIAINDSSADYQAGTSAIVLVMQVTIVVLIIFFIVAWITTGKVLYPLRLVTETAHSISESDMTLRIPVQGSDEIAELTTTLNEMLDRLQFAFDSQQRFLNDVSHELRTPITIIQGHLEMLQFCPEKQPETMALVMDELDRMNRLVNDLLLLAKTERPDFLKLKPEELDWLTEEIFLKARSFANRNWKLESKGLSPITVDRQRLTQAVMNLVQNAVRHTMQGDTITLGSSVKGDFVYIWVSDTGEGIAPENQKRIFDRFARATKHDQNFEGHGLGLSIVSAIAVAHGGKVELSSSLGYGSTFTIVIPLVPSNDAIHESNTPKRRPFVKSGLFSF